MINKKLLSGSNRWISHICELNNIQPILYMNTIHTRIFLAKKSAYILKNERNLSEAIHKFISLFFFSILIVGINYDPHPVRFSI